MTYVPYIYIQKNNGFIESTKLMKEIDLLSVKPGENITSFYNETYPLYNIFLKDENSDNYFLFTDSHLNSLTQADIQEKIRILFPQFLSQVSAAPLPDLHTDYKKSDGSIDRPSVFKEFMNSLEWKTNYKFDIESVDFSLDTYKHIANELHFLSDCLENNAKFAHFIKGSVKAFNTFLAYEGVVTNFKEGMFNTDRNEQEEEVIYFSTAMSEIHYAEGLIDSSNAFEQLKNNTKKMKI